MENNEENLGSQEPTNQTTATSVKSGGTKSIAIIVAVVAVLLALFFMIFTRSAKSTVKSYVKAFEKGKSKQIVKMVDYEGKQAFDNITKYSFAAGGNTYDFAKFEEEYKKIKDDVKAMDKDKKKAYNEKKDKYEETLKASVEAYKALGIKMSLKNIKTEKVKDCKKITKVTATMKMKKDSQEHEEEVTFYLLKKGLKYYIISDM